MKMLLTAALCPLILIGCADHDPSLAMDATDIRVLCKAVADKAMAEAPILLPNGQERPDARVTLEWTRDGAKAECELKYRIKQQEANKPF